MRVSVVIRSYKRPEALKELLARVRRQRYDDFEVVILEQSDDPALVADIAAYGDPRIHVVATSPKNPPAARNAAISHARGEIILLIDDDDLPLTDDWIALHAANYEDPLCMGVAGRLVPHPERRAPPRFPRYVRALTMTQTFWKDTRLLAHGTLRKERIDFLPGSNVSVRRSLVERVGGWDEGIPMNEEQSFAFKFQRTRKPGERFVFDPLPEVWRRTDVPGGLDRRRGGDWSARELDAWLFYFEHVVGHYFPVRYKLLYPLFVLRGLTRVSVWVWEPDNSHLSVGERLSATLALVRGLPAAQRSQRFRAEDVRRV